MPLPPRWVINNRSLEMAKYGQPVQLVNNILAFIWKRYKTNKKSFFRGIRLQQLSNFSVFLVLVCPGILLPLYFGASESIMGHYLLVLPTHPDPTTFLVTIPRNRTAESIFHIFFFFFKDLNKSIASKSHQTPRLGVTKNKRYLCETWPLNTHCVYVSFGYILE